MASTDAKRKKVKTKKGTVGDVEDLSNHPFFVKKAQEAEAFIEKHGAPVYNEEVSR